ncbi:protoporphyrinogen/coproporphyrinogen oxidase [Desulfosoma caldarium]|uniref:UDP-galactopyranose mutase n=1 Tax=Desulfosoma caldarium TaxID=610254 RepID=A0A3N1UM13_9BACT|nr:FAD-dependent oxidoreductase [Desulfosoma caldarium]ROQ90768.1 UDP-galactopyranose mutase [Desulfosoma caldarium]
MEWVRPDVEHYKYVIVGAGPTGLGAAHRLAELGERDFLVLEQNPYPGGLSASFKDSKGFTWDLGGHVIFSHYPYFDRLIEDLLQGEYLTHQRKAFIRIADTWVPYPFQNNIRYLPPILRWECIVGLLHLSRADAEPQDFREWIHGTFGDGIARHFMIPYNFKVWAFPPQCMDWRWIGERVSVVDLERVLKNVVLEQDDVSWGPNNTFRFPLRGGTGEIFRRLAARVSDHIAYSSRLVSMEPHSRLLQTDTGRRITYHRLLNTSPLDRLILETMENAPQSVRSAAEKLIHNGVHVVGIGIDQPGNDDKCWMYFPEPNCPFYRVTNFHNYSPYNTPKKRTQKALMGEISFSTHKPQREDTVVDETIAGLVDTRVVTNGEAKAIVSRWQAKLDYAYPVPNKERDTALRIIHPWLESLGIYSRGRFGGWKYEVGNMDHSVIQGVEWADRMVMGKEESVYVPC